MCNGHCAICIVQLKCAIMCNCTLCIALQSCVMYNVQLKCICAFTAPSLNSQWSDQATAALLFISLISPFSSLHLFFCFLFFIFHFTPFISTFVFTLWCISPVLIFTQFFTSMISAFFATTWNSLPTAHKAALSPFSISPDLQTYRTLHNSRRQLAMYFWYLCTMLAHLFCLSLYYGWWTLEEITLFTSQASGRVAFSANLRRNATPSLHLPPSRVDKG